MLLLLHVLLPTLRLPILALIRVVILVILIIIVVIVVILVLLMLLSTVYLLLGHMHMELPRLVCGHESGVLKLRRASNSTGRQAGRQTAGRQAGGKQAGRHTGGRASRQAAHRRRACL